MVDVVTVSIDETKNIYYLSPNSFNLNLNDMVIFKTDNGLFSGRVIKANYVENENNLVLPLNKVIRLCEDSDVDILKKNSIISEKAFRDAKKISNELGLDMNFIDSFLNFDGTQLMISFLADNRVDFRELAKKLAQKYKTRIELRQIGVRDKSKKIGGIGPCGLMLCCNSFLTDFNSVSINMAKNQNLALNPSKINGICGRLLCCLGYENDIYTDLKKNLPKIGYNAETPHGMGKVVAVDYFNNCFSVDLGDKGIVKIMGDNKNNGND